MTQETEPKMSNSPSCIKCKSYFVTWEPKTPHGCRAYGFKGKEMPSVIVFKTSGMACQQFIEKNPPKNG